VVLSVRDTGIGIPEAEQDQLFSRFFRASNAVDRAVPGTGLGLTIVRSIVEHHGGSLELDSSPGRATTFTVRLPLVRPEEESAGEGPHEEQDDGQRRFDALGLSLAD
ncbi:MAG TPA: ATP-binding protein, partial [Actinomycetales bacterium]|nr:ATP-binding protein [Actinomycetales bacterium]